MSQKISKAWQFLSSNGRTRYQTLQYADGSTSCDCPGWTRRTAMDGSRTCKHTRAVQMGSADLEAESMKDYGVPVTVSAPVTQTTAAAQTFGSVKRKIR